MNLFIYSDESGVFDKIHNDYFVFGGLILLGKSMKDDSCRRYAAVETLIRKNNPEYGKSELKASRIHVEDKRKLYGITKHYYSFGVIVSQKQILERIFLGKKDKQRYLDYAFKIGIKRALEHLVKEGIIIPNEVENMYFCIDEHSTATNGLYELKEGLEQEFKAGTYNFSYDKFFCPLFPNMGAVNLEYCNSSKRILVRASDIIANVIYHNVLNGTTEKILNDNIFLTRLP